MNSDRLHALDNLRAFLALLGIPFRVAFVLFLGVAQTTHHLNIDSSQFLAVPVPRPHQITFLILFYTRIFRMPAFFLLAGFFAHMLYNQAGTKHLFKNRLFKIGIPFLLFMLWLIPGYFEYVLLLISKPVSNAGNLSNLFFAALVENYHNGVFRRFMNNTRDLWFLYDLLWFYLFTVVVLMIKKILLRSKKIEQISHKIILQLLSKRWIYVWMPLLSAVFLVSHGYWFDVLDTKLTPSFILLVFYGIWYLIGWWMWRHKDQLMILGEGPWLQLCISILAYAIYLALYFSFVGRPILWAYGLAMISYSISMTLAVFALLGIAFRYFSGHQKILKYFSDASYWIYLAQMPILFLLMPMVIYMTSNFYLQFFSGTLLGAMISVLSYHWFIRNTTVGTVLGMKKR